MHDLEVVVLDEAPMMHKDLLESLDLTFKWLRDSALPFGGISVVLGGDFCQTLPVIKGATRFQQVDASIRTSQLFSLFDVYELHENERTRQVVPAERTRKSSQSQRVGRNTACHRRRRTA